MAPLCLFSRMRGKVEIKTLLFLCFNRITKIILFCFSFCSLFFSRSGCISVPTCTVSALNFSKFDLFYLSWNLKTHSGGNAFVFNLFVWHFSDGGRILIKLNKKMQSLVVQ